MSTAIKDNQPSAPTSCFPKLTTPRGINFSPRYFFSLTPRTKANVGEDDFTEGLRLMRAQFPGHEDYDMAPFLRITGGNSNEAIKMYQDCLDWRLKNLPITKESCSNALNNFEFYFHGVDRDGRPVGYLSMRGHDPKTRNLDEYTRAMVYRVEELAARQPPKEFQVTIILDRNDVSSKNQDNDMMKVFFALFSEKYPNKLNKVLVYPSGLAFRTLWQALKYTFPERVRNKVIMIGSEKDLLQHVAADNLIKSMGGTDNYNWRQDSTSSNQL